MRFSIRPKLAILFPALAAATAAQPAPQPLAPTGKWNVAFADARCIARRNYGTAENPLRLVLKAPPVGNVIQIAAVRQGDRTPAEHVEATVTIEGQPRLKTNLLMFTAKDSTERVYLLNLPSAEFASVRQAMTLSVRSSRLDVTFVLSQMEPLLKLMDDCVADLRRAFNVGATDLDPTRFRNRARGNIAKFFSSDDYPRDAGRKGQSGRVGFALLIGEDGRVADCTIVATSGVPALDSQACALLKSRARLEPAVGIDGQPAKDSLVGAIIWRIP